MQEWAGSLVQALDRGPAVLATVIWTQGSVPREVGAKLLIDAHGDLQGTIGGGAGEHKVCQSAAVVLHSGRPCLVEVDLTGSIGPTSAREGICGGRMGVWLCRWQGSAARQLAAQIQSWCEPTWERSDPLGQLDRLDHRSDHLERLDHLDHLERSDPSQQQTALPPSPMLVLPLGADPPHLRPASPADPPFQLSESEYRERLQPLPLLLIVGAGHVGTALAQVAPLAGFRVWICDDRPEWADPERFPSAQVGSLSACLPALRAWVDPSSRPLYVALVTRGYGPDLEALTQILPLDPEYLGMIGSRRRVKAVVEQLGAQAGSELAQRLHQIPFYAPIGLDIGALTPGEIAVSIVAELIQHRRGGRGRSLAQ